MKRPVPVGGGRLQIMPLPVQDEPGNPGAEHCRLLTARNVNFARVRRSGNIEPFPGGGPQIDEIDRPVLNGCTGREKKERHKRTQGNQREGKASRTFQPVGRDQVVHRYPVINWGGCLRRNSVQRHHPGSWTVCPLFAQGPILHIPALVNNIAPTGYEPVDRLIIFIGKRFRRL